MNKKNIIIIILLIIVLELLVGILAILNTDYSYTSYTQDGQQVTTYQKIGDYIFNKD